MIEHSIRAVIPSKVERYMVNDMGHEITMVHERTTHDAPHDGFNYGRIPDTPAVR